MCEVGRERNLRAEPPRQTQDKKTNKQKRRKPVQIPVKPKRVVGKRGELGYIHTEELRKEDSAKYRSRTLEIATETRRVKPKRKTRS